MLEFAEIYAQDPGALTDELADGVKRHFGEAGLVCLIEALGFIEGRIRLALMFTALAAAIHTLRGAWRWVRANRGRERRRSRPAT